MLMTFILSYSQESKEILEMLVEKQIISQNEADKLIKESSAQKEPSLVQKEKSAFQSEAFRLSGYGQIIYDWKENADAGGANNSINVARAILFAVGRLGSQNQFGYMLMYDFGPKHCLHELYGEWLPVNAFNVRFGQYKTPFTMENPMSPTRIETINFTRSALALSGSTGDFNGLAGGAKAGRDAGIQISGQLFPADEFSRMEYYAGLFNGTGFNTSDSDNHKDFIGTAYWLPVKGFRIGGSIYCGKLHFGLNPNEAASYGLSNELAAGSHVRNRWVVGAEYNGKHCYVRSEYIAGNDGGLRRAGCYGTAVWKFIPNKWEALGKYDFYDKNTAVDKNEINEITVGINCYFAYLCRIQLNYIHTDDKASGKNNSLAAQLQLFF
jgi:hypothetical protein